MNSQPVKSKFVSVGLFLCFYVNVSERFLSVRTTVLWFTTCIKYLLLIKVAFKRIHKNGNQISRFFF